MVQPAALWDAGNPLPVLSTTLLPVPCRLSVPGHRRVRAFLKAYGTQGFEGGGGAPLSPNLSAYFPLISFFWKIALLCWFPLILALIFPQGCQRQHERQRPFEGCSEERRQGQQRSQRGGGTVVQKRAERREARCLAARRGATRGGCIRGGGGREEESCPAANWPQPTAFPPTSEPPLPSSTQICDARMARGRLGVREAPPPFALGRGKSTRGKGGDARAPLRIS